MRKQQSYAFSSVINLYKTPDEASEYGRFMNPVFGSVWSKKQWLLVTTVAVSLWLLYAFVGPGADFHVCYTKMVVEPASLQTVVDVPWTQNPPWLALFMAPFVTMPGRAGYILFVAVTIAMILWGVYLFGGRPLPVLLSAHLFWILWWVSWKDGVF